MTAPKKDPNGDRFAPDSEDITITPSPDPKAKNGLDALREAGIDVDSLTDQDVTGPAPKVNPE